MIAGLCFIFDPLDKVGQLRGCLQVPAARLDPPYIKRLAVSGDDQAHEPAHTADVGLIANQVANFHGWILLRQARLLARFLRSVCFPALLARRIIARARGLRFLVGRFFIFYNHYSKVARRSQGKKENKIKELRDIF
jgi:hypothetical protein